MRRHPRSPGLLSLLVALLAGPALAACADARPPPVVDRDGDGFLPPEDCAPDDPDRHPGAVERCDGLDDDCDGARDEGFADTDGDGALDCAGDRRCEPVAEVPPPPPERTCPRGLYDGELRVETQWAWSAWSADAAVAEVRVAPVVAHLDDEDGDGVPGGGADVPEVILLASSRPASPARQAIVVLSGADGEERWSREGPWLVEKGVQPGAALLAADVDADGETEIVAIEQVPGDDPHGAPSARAVALGPRGDVEWRSAPVCETCWVGVTDNWRLAREHTLVPTATDLEGDGAPEVLVGRRVLDGRDGSTKATVPEEPSSYLVPGDIDGDGRSELLADGAVYTSTGLERWRAGSRGSVTWGLVVPPLGDAPARVAFFGEEGSPQVGAYLLLLARDGTIVADVPLRVELGGLAMSVHGGPAVVPAAAPGTLEVLITALRRPGLGRDLLLGRVALPLERTVQRVLEANTAAASLVGESQLWSFDLGGEGVEDVAFSFGGDARLAVDGEGALPIGAARFGAVSTLVADVDADGAAEVLVAGEGGLALLRDPEDRWARAGTTWPQHHFEPGAIAEDGTVRPRSAIPAAQRGWLRARPVLDPMVDLHVALAGGCLASCGGEARLLVRVGNAGVAASAEGSATLRLEDADGRVLAEAALPALAPGVTAPPIELVVPALERVAGRRLVARVVRAAGDCAPANDAVTWSFADRC